MNNNTDTEEADGTPVDLFRRSRDNVYFKKQDARDEKKPDELPLDRPASGKISKIRLSFSVENDVWTISAPELGLSATCDSICYAVYNLYRQIDRTGIFDRPFREIVSESGGRIVFRFRDGDLCKSKQDKTEF